MSQICEQMGGVVRLNQNSLSVYDFKFDVNSIQSCTSRFKVCFNNIVNADNLEQIEKLGIKNCKFERFPLEIFAKLSNLKHLVLDNIFDKNSNLKCVIPIEIFGLYKLETLTIINNHFNSNFLIGPSPSDTMCQNLSITRDQIESGIQNIIKVTIDNDTLTPSLNAKLQGKLIINKKIHK